MSKELAKNDRIFYFLSSSEIKIFLMKKCPKSNKKTALQIYAKNRIITCFSVLSILCGELDFLSNGVLKKQCFLQESFFKFKNVK
jgi:SET domain-containing protein